MIFSVMTMNGQQIDKRSKRCELVSPAVSCWNMLFCISAVSFDVSFPVNAEVSELRASIYFVEIYTSSYSMLHFPLLLTH